MSSKWFRVNVNALSGYTPGFQPADREAIKINTNENPYGPSPGVVRALAALDDVGFRRYPSIMADPVRQAASHLHGVGADWVLVGNGGDELLALLVRACCGPGRPVAYPVPTYSLYDTLAAIADASTIRPAFGTDGSLPRELFGAEAPLTIVCNPNAPTTTFLEAERIAELLEAAKGLVLVDEAYVDFASGNCVGLLERYENVAILRSLSKGYSLAGMRCGYLLARPEVIETLVKIKDSYNVNIATQVAAAAALEDQEWFGRNRDEIVRERGRLTEALRRLGFEVGDSHTNFVLARAIERPAGEIHRKLMEYHIYVRYFSQEALADKLRITVGTPEQNDALLAALGKILES